MSDTPEIDREALLARVRELVAIEREEFWKSGDDCTVVDNGIPITETPFDGLDLESLRDEELELLVQWPQELPKHRAYLMSPEFQLRLQQASFAEQLKVRQGTHLPDFGEFYQDRDALDRRLFPRPDSEA